MDVSTSALVAQRTRMDVIAGNIASAFTTRDAEGRPNPYRRRVALLAAGQKEGNRPEGQRRSDGVHVHQIVEDKSPFQKRFDPGHVDAIPTGPDAGYVLFPNVDLNTEMVDAIEAARVYEANITVMEVTKSMANVSLRLLA